MSIPNFRRCWILFQSILVEWLICLLTLPSGFMISWSVKAGRRRILQGPRGRERMLSGSGCVGSIIFLCLLLHLLSRCWGKVFFLWGDDIAVLTFPPGNGVSLRRKCCRRGEMSWKAPQNQEKPQLQRENVPRSTPKSGETAAAERRGSTDATKNALPIKGRRFLFERQW